MTSQGGGQDKGNTVGQKQEISKETVERMIERIKNKPLGKPEKDKEITQEQKTPGGEQKS